MTEQYAYLPNFRFMLRVNGIDVPLKSVSAFQRENEYDYIQEGGMNDYVHLRRKPISKPYTLKVERYVPTDFDDPLSNGSVLLLPLMLFVGRNNGGKLTYGRYYVFTGAVVMGKEYGGLDSERGALLTESITIGYNQMFCITSADDDDSDSKEAWQFTEDDGSGATALNIGRKHSKTPKEPLQNKQNKRAFIAGAEKWKFKDKEKAGNKQMFHATLGEDAEEVKEDLIDKRRHFSFGATFNPLAEVDMNSKRSAVNADRESYGIKELTKDEMIDNAKKFELSKDGAMEGNGLLFAPKNIENNKASKSDLAKKKKRWLFGEDKKDKAGKGEHSTQNSLVTEHTTAPDGSSIGLGRPELSVDEMAKKAKKFQLTEDNNVMGNGVVSAPREIEKNKKQKKDFITDAQKWEFDNTSKAGKGESRRDYKGIKEDEKQSHIDGAKKFELTDAKTVGGNGVLLSPHEIEKNKTPKQTFIDNAKKFAMTNKDTPEGNGVTQAPNDIEANKVRKDKFVGAAKKFAMTNKDTPEGNGVRQAPNDIEANKVPKDTFVGAAKRFEMQEGSVMGNNVIQSPHDIEANKTPKSGFEGASKKFEMKEGSVNGNDVIMSPHDIEANKVPKETFAKATQKFEMKEGSLMGNNVILSPHDIEANKPHKDTFAKATRKFEMQEDSVTGNGVLSSTNEIEANKQPKDTFVSGAKKFAMTDKESVGGNGVLLSPHDIEANKQPKGSFTDAAKSWEFNGTGKAGGGTPSRSDGGIKEPSKQEMAGKAQRGMTTNKAIADFLMQ